MNIKFLISLLVIVGFVGLTVTSCMAGMASFTRSWIPPTENVDQTPYDDPGGYRLYWSKTAGQYSIADSKRILDPATTTYIVTLPEGKYCFVCTAIDDADNESAYSNEVCETKIVQPEKPSLQ